MAVVCTAGHVDHGKSALVRALTGIEPDRFAEERRRGITIELGFAWTTTSGGEPLYFVDVPGHERFVPTMLAGAGPVPAVMFVVAADGGWMPQSAEHLAVLDALDVRHGLLVISRADLADPGPALAAARSEIARTSMAGLPSVAVSARTGAGLPELRAGLDRLTASLPQPLSDAPVRLWVDRAFGVDGTGTVVTGTLAAGTIRVGDELLVSPGDRRVVVRSLQSGGTAVDVATPVRRLAVGLRGIELAQVARGDALVTLAAWTSSDVVDVRVPPRERWPAQAVLHLGAAARTAALRPLAPDLLRVRLDAPLPWHVGDRAVLRDPGAHAVLAGATVLDPEPPDLRRRGAARDRAAALATTSGVPDVADELRRRGLTRTATLTRLGVAGGAEIAPGYHLGAEHRLDLVARLTALVDAAPTGLPLEEARARLGLPDVRIVRALAVAPLEIASDRVRRAGAGLPPRVADGVAAALAGRARFVAPDADDLTAAGLSRADLAAAVREGLLDQVAPGVYLAGGSVDAAAGELRALPSSFTAAEARTAWGTTRRVAVPLLELLAARRVTRRLPDGRHALR